MSERCKHVEKNGFNCGSYAFNLYKDGIDQGNLCDVHYWQAKALAQQEQEPVAWMLTDKNINSIQVDSIQRLIDRLKHAHHIDLCVRINGQDEWYEADWLKHLTCTTPPQQEPVAYWKEHAQGLQRDYDSLLADFQAQRTWVGLTDDDIEQLHTAWILGGGFLKLCDDIEAKLKEKNHG